MELAIQTGSPVRFRVIAMALALVLVLIAAVLYQRHTKEALFANSLFTLRVVIDEYTFDKQKAPRTMRDLVDSGYLRSILLDPLTGKELFVRQPRRGEQDVFDLR
jgi:hypothetical protein